MQEQHIGKGGGTAQSSSGFSERLLGKPGACFPIGVTSLIFHKMKDIWIYLCFSVDVAVAGFARERGWMQVEHVLKCTMMCLDAKKHLHR